MFLNGGRVAYTVYVKGGSNPQAEVVDLKSGPVDLRAPGEVVAIDDRYVYTSASNSEEIRVERYPLDGKRRAEAVVIAAGDCSLIDARPPLFQFAVNDPGHRSVMRVNPTTGES